MHVARVAPILHARPDGGHQSLREITRQDILGALPGEANQHRQALSALRSLFRFLKGRHVVFADPAARLRHDRLHSGQPLPLNLDTVREAIHGAQPARAALAALVACHALRSGQLASLELTDVRDGRLHLDGRVIPLAGPVRERVAARLDERARRWPATVNPHLFINWYTAVRETPVSSPWISHTLGTSPQAIREDHILDEALATGGDIRRLCDLFGLTVGGAERYTRPAETGPWRRAVPCGLRPGQTVCVNGEEILFRSGDLYSTLAGQQAEALRAVEEWDADQLLATAEADVIDYLVAKYSVACPVLDRDRIEQLPVSEEVRTVQDRIYAFNGDTIQYRMTKIVVTVPFTGDKDVFRLHPSQSWAPARAQVREGELPACLDRRPAGRHRRSSGTPPLRRRTRQHQPHAVRIGRRNRPLQRHPPRQDHSRSRPEEGQTAG